MPLIDLSGPLKFIFENVCIPFSIIYLVLKLISGILSVISDGAAPKSNPSQSYQKAWSWCEKWLDDHLPLWPLLKHFTLLIGVGGVFFVLPAWVSTWSPGLNVGLRIGWLILVGLIALGGLGELWKYLFGKRDQGKLPPRSRSGW